MSEENGNSAPNGASIRKPKRDYSDEFRAAAIIDARHMGPSAAARRHDVPLGTLRKWIEGERKAEVTAQFLEEHKGDMALALESLAWRLLASVPKKIDKAPLNHTMTGVGIAIDKLRLIKDQPTSIHGSQVMEPPPGLDLSLLSPEERNVLQEIVRRVNERARELQQTQQGGAGEPTALHTGSVTVVGEGTRQLDVSGQSAGVHETSVGGDTEPRS